MRVIINKKFYFEDNTLKKERKEKKYSPNTPQKGE